MLWSVLRPWAGLGPRASLGLAIATCGISALGAQEPQEAREGPSWAFRGLRSHQCVRFLVAPGSATRVRREGYRPIRADQYSKLHPALRSVLDAQPEFASWSPSALCFFSLDTVSVGGRTIAEKNARKPQMIAVWTLPAIEQRSGTHRDLVLDLAAGSSRLVQAIRATRLAIRKASSAISKSPQSEDELHDFRIDKTRLIWTGRTAGDSSRVQQPIKESWLVKGASGTTRAVTLTLRPSWTRSLVGVLRVEGKDDLAKALKSSPIRFVGPRHFGGSADLLFSR